MDLPYFGFVPSAVKMDEPPVRLTPGFMAALEDADAVAAAEIPVEPD